MFELVKMEVKLLVFTQSIVDDFFINRRYTNVFILSHGIYLELGMINCSGVNFFVYILRSSRFREELARFVCFGFLKNKKARLKKEGVTVDTTATGTSAVINSETLL